MLLILFSSLQSLLLISRWLENRVYAGVELQRSDSFLNPARRPQSVFAAALTGLLPGRALSRDLPS